MVRVIDFYWCVHACTSHAQHPMKEGLKSGRDLSHVFVSCRWDVEMQLTDDPPARFGAWLLGPPHTAGDGVRFDPAAFSLSGQEAAMMDPQQRLLLELSAEVRVFCGFLVCDCVCVCVGGPLTYVWGQEAIRGSNDGAGFRVLTTLVCLSAYLSTCPCIPVSHPSPLVHSTNPPGTGGPWHVRPLQQQQW